MGAEHCNLFYCQSTLAGCAGGSGSQGSWVRGMASSTAAVRALPGSTTSLWTGTGTMAHMDVACWGAWCQWLVCMSPGFQHVCRGDQHGQVER